MKGCDFVDIMEMSVSMHQASLQNSVSISLMKMMMDNRENTAAQMTEMISDIAVDPNIGRNIDATV